MARDLHRRLCCEAVTRHRKAEVGCSLVDDRPAADSHEHEICAEGSFGAAVAHVYHEPATGPLGDTGDLRGKADGDRMVDPRSKEGDKVRIHARDLLRKGLDRRDLATECLEHAGDLKADIAASDHS